MASAMGLSLEGTNVETSLPTGTVTFLFTDIEGSTRLWEEHPEGMTAAVARHDTLLRTAITTHGGSIFKTMGDAFFAAFPTPPQALAAALQAQQALHAEAWGDTGPLRVRMALNTGVAELRGGDYFGAPLNRIARLLTAGHGGQVLLSQATFDLVQPVLPDGTGVRDLGAHRLKDLQQPERIFQLLHPDLPADFPALRSLEAFAHNLPRQLTSFIGRQREIADVKRLLAKTALLTLTGAGGSGKTRLALQVAAEVLDEYPDGVWLVELASLADPTLAPQTVASVLGVREESGRPLTATLADYLRGKQALLVLDNCEHLLSACAGLGESLLRACPKLQILATSREGLGVGGEQTYRVPTLSLPDPGQLPPLERLQEFEAVQLFADRARLTQPTFAVTAANAPAVVQVCDRLDGIPLAIELAAARVKTLAVEQIVERLAERFRLLTGGSRTALPRQQTLKALVDWSYDLLSEPERVLLRRLSIFAGGWTLEAAEGVCAGNGIEEWEMLDLLTALVDKSLVVVAEQGEEVRYRLLETIRQYGQEKLGGSEEAVTSRDRHQEWYLARAEQAELDLGADHENLEAALEWSMQRGDAEAALRLVEALHNFWYPRGYMREGRERLGKALALPGAEAPTAARVQALTRAGYWAFRLGDYQGARELLEGALTIGQQLGIQNRTRGALYYLGHVALFQGDYQAARALYEEVLTIVRQPGDQDSSDYAAWPLLSLGDLANWEGDYEGARALSEESLAIFRQMGNRYGIAGSLHCLGDVARNQGDYQGARALYEESLEIFRQIGDQGGIASSLEGLAAVARSQREYKEATVFYKESLGIHRRTGEPSGVASGLEGLAGVAADDQAERAARLFGAAEALRESIGAPLPRAERADYDRRVAAVRSTLGEEAFAAAWAAGRAMSPEQAIAYTLEHGSDDTPDRTQ